MKKNFVLVFILTGFIQAQTIATAPAWIDETDLFVRPHYEMSIIQHSAAVIDGLHYLGKPVSGKFTFYSQFVGIEIGVRNSRLQLAYAAQMTVFNNDYLSEFKLQSGRIIDEPALEMLKQNISLEYRVNKTWTLIFKYQIVNEVISGGHNPDSYDNFISANLMRSMLFFSVPVALKYKGVDFFAEPGFSLLGKTHKGNNYTAQFLRYQNPDEPYRQLLIEEPLISISKSPRAVFFKGGIGLKPAGLFPLRLYYSLMRDSVKDKYSELLNSLTLELGIPF